MAGERLIMSFFIFLCLVFCTQSVCLSASLSGEACEYIQEEGEQLANNIEKFDKLLQDVVMRCYEESQLITESSLKFLKENMGSLQVSQSTNLAPVESKAHISYILKAMGKALEVTFINGHAKFFTLVKQAGSMIVEDSIVVDALIKIPQNQKRNVPQDALSYRHNIDDKIETLRQTMNTSLIDVEKNLHGVAAQLFTMLTSSLKMLTNDQQFKMNLDKIRGSMSKYLIEAIHNVIDSHVERFFLLVKDSALLIEAIDSSVANIKNDPVKLDKALSPAKLLIDEEISQLGKSVGVTEMKRQLQMKLTWMQNEYKNLKISLKG